MLTLVRAASLALAVIMIVSEQAYAESFGECAMFQSILIHEHREGISPDPELHAFLRTDPEFKNMAQKIDFLVPMIASEGSREGAIKSLSKLKNIDPSLKQGMVDCLYIVFSD